MRTSLASTEYILQRTHVESQTRPLHTSLHLAIASLLTVHSLLTTYSPLALPPTAPSLLQGELEREGKTEGADLSSYSKSTIVATTAPKALGTLRGADGAED